MWYRRTIAETVVELETNLSIGLATEECERRQRNNGFNELREKPKETLWHKFMQQLRDFLVLVLLAASVISIFAGDVTDSLVIIAIVILNASLGVFQETKAEKALEALREMSAPTAKALRDGRVAVVPARELVPGDVVFLEAGDYIPADVRLIEAVNLQMEESSLTGESAAVEKGTESLLTEVALGDRTNIGFMGTVVTYGRGKGIVVQTGMETEIGKIAEMLQTLTVDMTPLQLKLKEFGKFLGFLCLVICGMILAVGMYTGYRDGTLSVAEVQFMIMTAISLAVAAIPEGLPTVVTIVLALGVQRMAGKKAIVKKLHAVETLGSTTIICSDKTGTLTQNQMTAVRVFAGGSEYAVSGSGYQPEGEFVSDDVADPAPPHALEMLLRGALLCNDADLRSEVDRGWRIVGDPTEGALLVLAAKGGYGKERQREYPRLAEIPFDSVRKMMTTFHQSGDGKVVAFTKGAPDIVLERCDSVLLADGVRVLSAEMAAQLQRENGAMAAEALRVLAIACRTFETVPERMDSAWVEEKLTLLGLVGIIDPARPEAKAAVSLCASAGIRPIMITGDHPATALAIAKDLGIATEDGQVRTGRELDGLSDAAMDEAVRETNVFARVSPANKMAIVEALRRANEIVAMTGDGVNDAPALKKAHIGIAMGIAGTDVTKEAADMVIADDNFSSIVAAVEEGRVIFANIKKFIYFLLSCNAAEVLVVFGAMLLGWPIPLLPIQLLWVNLVTDAFPALALGLEKREPHVMQKPPRDPQEALLNRRMKKMIAVQSMLMMVAVLGAFQWGWQKYGGDLSAARTFAFVVLILSQLICAYSARSEEYTVFSLGVFSNRYLNAGATVSLALLGLSVYGPLHSIFKTVEPATTDLLVMLAWAPLPFVGCELYKLFGVGKEAGNLPQEGERE